MPVESKGGSDSDSRFVSLVEKFKGHPLGYILIAIIVSLGAVAAAYQGYQLIKTAVVNSTNPYHAQKDAIASLALGGTVEFVNGKLGQPQQSGDLCRQVSFCAPDQPDEVLLNVYRDEQYTVRAVFEQNSLEFFAVTVETEKFKPDISWLGYELGQLGEFTYADAEDAMDGDVHPTALASQSSAYAEVIAVGGAGDYQGLMLAWALDGYGNLPWNAEGARKLNESHPANAADALKVAEDFRAGSAPKT
jgi:hypothetical protein